MNLIFIGMSGSGKSSLAAYCSKILNMPLCDTDEQISRKFGDVAELISSGNEAFFRAAEEKELIDISLKQNYCVATGGGAVLNAEGMSAIKKSGLVVYLKCSPETLCERLKKDKIVRPLLGASGDLLENINKMLLERSALYEKYADIIVYEDEVLKSRGVFDDELEVQLGALYIELVRALEKKVYEDRKKYART